MHPENSASEQTRNMAGIEAVGRRRCGLPRCLLLLLVCMPAALPQHNRTTAAVGQTSTLLSDGQLLLLGGEQAGRPSAAAHIFDPGATASTPLPSGMQFARAWHTATVLPDGKIVILGGVGKDGCIVPAAELFNPDDGTFTPFPGVPPYSGEPPSPRVYHTATLLTDGRLLIVGGETFSVDSQPELWDFRTGMTTTLAHFGPNRNKHSARLLPDGNVLLSGGIDDSGAAIAGDEIFDATTLTFRPATPPSDLQGLALEASVPGNGAADYQQEDDFLTLRFSKPVLPSSLNAVSVTLTADGSEKCIETSIVVAEGGMLAFIAPIRPLETDMGYTLILEGPRSIAGDALPFTPVRFYASGESLASPNLAIPPPNPVPGGEKRGEPVDVATGLFVYTKTDLYVPGLMPIDITRTYRPGDSVSRAFGIGTSLPYDMFLVGEGQGQAGGNCYYWIDLILADGGKIRYNNSDPNHACGFASGMIFQHTATPTRFYGSTIAWNGDLEQYVLMLENGTTLYFPYAEGATSAVTGALVRIVDRNGNQLSITRGGVSARIVSSFSSYYQEINLTYDSNDAGSRIIQAADLLGRTVHYSYDSSGRLQTVTDANGGITHYTYDTANRMTQITDPRGIIYLTNQYDPNSNRVTQQTLANGGTYSYSYSTDGNGNVIQTNVTDPRGFIERLTLNSAGYVLTDTLALGMPEQRTFTYSRSAGNLTQNITDPLNRLTTLTYDNLGNLVNTRLLDGTQQAVQTSTAYQTIGGVPCIFYYPPIQFTLPVSFTDPLSHTTTLGYDAHGNVTTVTDPLGDTVTMTYNGCGNPASIASPAETMQTSYRNSFPLSLTDPLGRQVGFTYNGTLLVTLTDPAGNPTQYAYTPLNQISQITNALNGVTSFDYDPNGNLLSLTDPKGHATTYTYDNMDRRATRTDPLTHAESYQYDLNGNLTQFTDRKSQATNSTYDALNRLTHVTFADQSSITYAWDAGNRLTQVVDSQNGTITRTYDGLDRLLSETTPQGTVSYTYDAAGRRLTMSASGQLGISYTYDNANRLTQITQGTAVATIAYDNANRRAAVTLPNGAVMTYGYNAASDLTNLTWTKNGNPLGNLTYTYDQYGRMTQMGGTFARENLPAALSSASYNAANQLTQWGGSTLTYDLNGNLTSDGTHSYTWNARNHLAGGYLQYDAFGRRTRNPAGTSFLYDGLNPIQELSGLTVTANLLTGLGIDEIFSRTDSSGTFSFLTDRLGSTAALSDSTGTLQTQYTYAPFGAITTTSTNPYQFTGRENDGALYYYRARYYSPTFQRFISEDPLGFAGGSNLYEYVGSDPTGYSDPLGLDKKKPQCADIPDHPSNADIGKNVQSARIRDWLGNFVPPLYPLKYLWFYNQVHNGAAWDYKQQAKTLNDFGSLGPSPYADFGNFNFGAAGAAAGIPLDVLLRTAGWAQIKAGTSQPEWGGPFDRQPPFGDDPADQQQIRNGYDYYRNGCYK